MTIGDLAPLAAVKDWCGVTTTTDDALLATLIAQISRAICNSINRPFVLPTNVVDYYDGNGQAQLLLRHWPVGAIAWLTIDGMAIPPAPPLVVNAPPQPGYVLESAEEQPPGAMQQIYLRGYRFTKGRQNIGVAYRAGYEVLGETQIIPAALPYQLHAVAPYGRWAQDGGVVPVGGAAFAAVVAPVAAGQYAADPSGAYSFSPADAGRTVRLSYGYIPAELEQCALEWVADRYRYKDRIGLSSKSLGGQETTSYRITAMPDFVAATLANYRRVMAL